MRASKCRGALFDTLHLRHFQSTTMLQNKIKVALFLIFITGSFIIFCGKFQSISYEFKLVYTDCKLERKLNNVLNHTKWIVVTSIVKPTEQLKKLVAIRDWKVVVVGDEKTPTVWSYPGITFLSVEDQASLGYEIAKHLPHNSYTRKMIGYLYSIQHGAQFIYDTDDDNCPSGGEITFTTQPTTSGLILAHLNHSLLNPYAHFGQPSLWPRGYPLEHIAYPLNTTYYLCTINTPAIQQGLVNGNSVANTTYVTFNHRAPPFTLPQGVFAPFNSQNTLFSYHALWALFLPTTVHFRVTDIWRGYWAQTLLWLIGHHLAFHPPNAVQTRNQHNYLKDFEGDKETGKLIDFLSNWKCDNVLSFFQCVELLTADMVKHLFIGNNDLIVVRKWLSDLRAIGYREPERANVTLESMCLSSEIGTKAWVNFSPSRPPPNSGFYDLYDICQDHFVPHEYPVKFNNLVQQGSFDFENILLVISFSYPHLNNIRTLEAVYADHFPNIIFCAESSGYESLMKMINSGPLSRRRNDISFVNVTNFEPGFYGYECAIRAIEMNYKVDGYLVMSDDLLLRPWKLLPFDASRSRTQNDTFGPHSYQNVSDIKPNQKQWWTDAWGGIKGHDVVKQVFKELELISQNSSDPRSSLFRTFIQNRFSNGVNMSLSLYSMSDLYYVSKRESWMFAQVLKVFHKHRVYLNLAVPTTLLGCKHEQSLVNEGFKGISVLNGDRDSPFKFLTPEAVFVHPIKMETLASTPELLKSYCLEFVADYFSNW